MTTRFEGNKFVLDPRNGMQEVEISKGNNQRLYIQDIKNESVYSSVKSSALGNNELTLLENFQCSNTGVLRSQGTSVSIGIASNDSNAKYIAVGSPYYILGASQGGVGVLRAPTSNFTQQTTLVQTSFTTNAFNGKYSTMNKDCNTIVFSDDGAASSYNAMVYNRTGSTWTNTQNLASIISLSISPSGNYLLGCGYSQTLTVFFKSGTFSAQQTIATGSGDEMTVIKMVNDSNLVFCAIGASILRHWTRTGTTWSLKNLFNESSPILAVDYNDDIKTLVYITSSVMVVCSLVSTDLFEVQRLSSTATMVCMSDKYIFGGTSTTIFVYKNVFGTWTKSISNTTSSGIASMAATSGTLVVGCPSEASFGQVKIFNVIDFVDNELVVNEIDMNNSTNLQLTSNYGSIVFRTNGVNRLTIGSTGITSYPNNVFRYARFSLTSGDQAYTTPNLTNILYKAAVINDIAGLTYNTGTGVFTVANTTRLLVVSFTTYFSATNCSIIFRNVGVGANLCSISNSDSVFSNPAVSLSTIVDLSAGTTFSMQVYANTSGNIKGGTNQTFIVFYSLN